MIKNILQNNFDLSQLLSFQNKLEEIYESNKVKIQQKEKIIVFPFEIQSKKSKIANRSSLRQILTALCFHRSETVLRKLLSLKKLYKCPTPCLFSCQDSQTAEVCSFWVLLYLCCFELHCIYLNSGYSSEYICMVMSIFLVKYLSVNYRTS